MDQTDVEKLKITLGIRALFAVLGTVIAGTGSVVLYLNNINSQLKDWRQSTYTLPAAAEVALRMAIENPRMRVPDPRDPNKIIVVTASVLEGRETQK